MSSANSLKILVPIHSSPSKTSFHTILHRNMFSALGKKIHVEIIWFVYSSERYENLDSSEIVLHSYDYDNALEVLKENKPDIVFAYAGGPQGQIHYALSSASKFLNIPVCSNVAASRSPSSARLFPIRPSPIPAT